MMELELFGKPIPFDPVAWKEKNPYDCPELIITADGAPWEINPSHTEAALWFAKQATGMARHEVEDTCPQEYYGDYIRWLLSLSGAISVWPDMVIESAQHPANELQRETLRQLKDYGLYRGPL